MISWLGFASEGDIMPFGGRLTYGRQVLKEDCHESKVFGKAHLREVQDHQKKRSHQSYLRQPQAQTAPGLMFLHKMRMLGLPTLTNF